MKQILAIAKKELRAYFASPLALIFLGIFLVATLLVFFWVETFFRRNIADVRPLFSWLPVILIPLAAALTMRQWSDEQRMGTLEVLLTLPVATHRLVIGKFFAGLGIIALALGLTLGVPITVSMLGDIDWGPVFGGYFAALLLAGAYLAMGLCISAVTNNAVIALLLTVLATGALHLIGSDTLAGFASNRGAEIFRAIGTGSRFDAIQRGVVDLRDLIYFASLSIGFLFLNTLLLEAKRWSSGHDTAPKRSAVKVAAIAAVANLLLLNINIAGVRALRLDLTQNSEYSISKVTEKLLRGLDAPLVIRGYFSKETHPLLAPLVPRIRDMLAEYGLVGKQVKTEFIDPRSEPALEKEANEDYNIKPLPFQFADRHKSEVVNSYFHILIKYGDKHETLSFDDLIEAKVTGINNVEVKLRNLEYDLTRTIKKVVHGFQPIEEVFARAKDTVQLRAYLTAGSLPKNFKKFPELLAKVAKELGARAGAKLAFSTVDPAAKGQEGLREELFKKYGFRPLAASLFSQDAFYCHLVLSVGDRDERIFPAPDMTEATLRNEIEAALKRLVPGFLKTIGIVSSAPPAPPYNPMMGRRPPPPRDRYRLLRSKLSENYTARTVDLKDGRVPGDIDVLLVVGADKLAEKQRFAVDQYLMRGGALVVANGRFTLDPSGARGGIGVKKVESKLEDLLATWGIEVEQTMVLDPQNEAFPIPVERDVMGMRVREVQLLSYPYWVDVRASGMATGTPVLAGLPSVTLQWASPLKVKPVEGLKSTVLLSSTEKSWTSDGTNVQPDFVRYRGKGFGAPAGAKLAKRPLAVLTSGSFTSGFKGKPSPLLKAAEGAAPKAPAAKQGGAASKERGGRSIDKSPHSSRLAVIGSSDFLNDDVLNISRQTGSDRFLNSLRLVQNLVDWAVADVDLLTIRSRGSYARTLLPMEDGERTRWELLNYGIALVALFALIALAAMRRRSIRPLLVTKSGARGGE